MGRKKQPHYRVVVTDRTFPRDGRFVESLGHYNPVTNPARLVIDLERVDYWVSQGAVPSDTVNSLLQKARKGGDEGLVVGEASVEAEKARKAEELVIRRKVETELAAKKVSEAKAADAAAAAEAAAATAAATAAAEATAAAAEAAAPVADTDPVAQAGPEAPQEVEGTPEVVKEEG
jgi:small subunit ribosomal protein S16